jgi:nitroimidazol reductase NimA-like FMN-containing flavoprotein (pyridoxamine 5'-phosphate oxidase superfamily)
MAASEPIAEKLSSPDGAPLTELSWADARIRLADSEDYLLATSGESGLVHMVPVLGVWLKGAVCFCTGRQTRKSHHLTENHSCAVTVPAEDIDLVVEGSAQLVRDTAELQRIADLYPAKYPWWHPIVRHGQFHDPADTSLTDPQHVFAVAPKVVFAFGKTKAFTATRWRF